MRPPGGILSPGESIIATGNCPPKLVLRKVRKLVKWLEFGEYSNNYLTYLQYSSSWSHQRTMRSRLIRKARLSLKS